MFVVYNKFIKESYLNELLNNINFKKDIILINGNEYLEQRYTYWISDINKSYCYGGKIMKPSNSNIIVKKLQEEIKLKLGIYFDSVLINYYESGNIGMKYHSDEVYNEWEEESVIISFGESRKLTFREINNKNIKTDVYLNNGDLLYMQNGCQTNYQHKVCKNKSQNERISLVFKKSKCI